MSTRHWLGTYRPDHPAPLKCRRRQARLHWDEDRTRSVGAARTAARGPDELPNPGGLTLSVSRKWGRRALS